MKDYLKIVETWFSRLEKGYAMPPYSKSQLRVLKNVLAEMNIVRTIDTQKINEAPKDKERLEKIIAILRQNPAFISAIFRETMKYSDEGVDIETDLQKSTGESDHKKREILKYFVRAINDTPGDYDDIERFVLGYGQFDFIDSAKLMKGPSTFNEFIVSKNDVSKEFLNGLFLNLFDLQLSIQGSQRGPGEIGLALLSPNITFASVGDLKIGNLYVEVKGEKSKGGGRLRNSMADFGKTWLDAGYLDNLYDKLGLPNDGEGDFERKYKITGTDSPNNLLRYAQYMENQFPNTGKEFVKTILDDVFINAPQNMKDRVVEDLMTKDWKSNSQSMMEIAYMNYVEVLKGKSFSHFLLLNKPKNLSLAFKLDDYKTYLNKYFNFSSLSFSDKTQGPAIQLNMK